jgi:hypothetical protein
MSFHRPRAQIRQNVLDAAQELEKTDLSRGPNYQVMRQVYAYLVGQPGDAGVPGDVAADVVASMSINVSEGGFKDTELLAAVVNSVALALKRMYRTLEIDFGSTKAASMIVKMAPQFRIDLDW